MVRAMEIYSLDGYFNYINRSIFIGVYKGLTQFVPPNLLFNGFLMYQTAIQVQKKNPTFTKGLYVLCRGRDLNPHTIADTGF